MNIMYSLTGQSQTSTSEVSGDMQYLCFNEIHTLVNEIHIGINDHSSGSQTSSGT